MTATTVGLIALAYGVVLFSVALWGDERADRRPVARRPWIYSLALAVYCTSWTFFGAVGQAASSPWAFLPIYLGPALMFLLGGGIIGRIIELSRRSGVTSIADFLAARYGAGSPLARLVVVLVTLATVPYIALQLSGIVLAFHVLAPQTVHASSVALVTAAVLAAFAVLFGTRRLSSSESQQGMVFAIALESVVKLLAFVAVGTFIVSHWREPVRAGLVEQVRLLPTAMGSADFIVTTMLAGLAVLCLPRQFHIMVVENTDPRDLRVARWVFPAYLLLFSVFVVPVMLAGQSALGGQVGADAYILALPLAAGRPLLSVLGFIGGVSAATAMVIVASVALSTMISNEIVLPRLIRHYGASLHGRWVPVMRRTRQLVIVALLAAAWLFHQAQVAGLPLAATGLIAFTGIAQLAPALLLGLYWRLASGRGAFVGTALGMAIWLYSMVLPTVVPQGAVAAWLDLPGLLGWSLGNAVTDVATLSLLLNTAAVVGVSLLGRTELREQVEAERFLQRPGGPRHPILIEDLIVLLDQFLGAGQGEAMLAAALPAGEALDRRRTATDILIDVAERVLSGTTGASTARALIDSLGSTRLGADVAAVLDQTSSAVRFNRELLQASLDNMTQAVSVIDGNQRLVAWNRRYAEMFGIPDELLRVGEPIEHLVRFNAQRGLLGEGDPQHLVRRRLDHLRAGRSHRHERRMPDGRYLEIRGEPMPGGGFVTTFSDVTEYRRAQQQLHDANVSLERRVEERTGELQTLNRDLAQARAEAEAANLSKTRFLAAASHDLMQPLNAARLFASAAAGRASQSEVGQMLAGIEHSLVSMEGLLGSLLDISKLDAGVLPMTVRDVPLADVFNTLATEFGVLAEQRRIELRVHPTSLWVRTDAALLKRILQNFLSNALRYTTVGRIVLGARRLDGRVRIEVLDSGPGIPERDQQRIFDEFQRLSGQDAAGERGFGLGLAICRRIAQLLEVPLNVRSVPGRGSAFCVTVARADPATATKAPAPRSRAAAGNLAGLRVLCVDNDPDSLQAMRALLGGWQCEVATAHGLDDALEAAAGQSPDVVIVDFHLDDGVTGTDVLAALAAQAGRAPAALLVTADHSGEADAAAASAGCRVLRKPVKPAALRALLSRSRPVV